MILTAISSRRMTRWPIYYVRILDFVAVWIPIHSHYAVDFRLSEFSSRKNRGSCKGRNLELTSRVLAKRVDRLEKKATEFTVACTMENPYAVVTAKAYNTLSTWKYT